MDSEGMHAIKECACIIDVMNSQGEPFINFLRGVKMTVANGRKGREAFTCTV